MSEEKKIVKGGFRASLALLISVIALIVAIMAYQRTMDEEDYRGQITDLQKKIENLKRETAEGLQKARQETADTLESLGKAIRKKDQGD